MEHFPARITVDLDAIANNIARVKQELSDDTAVMAIIKANAYGHGLTESARAAIKGGATWLGVAKIGEALALRKSLNAKVKDIPTDCVRIFSWIYGPDAPFEDILQAGLDISVSTISEVNQIAVVARNLGGVKGRLHIKVDTGFSRNGFTLGEFSDFKQALELVKRYENEGLIELEGVWSHLANADTPLNKSSVQKTFDQQKLFDEAVALIEEYDLHPKFKHLSASAATLLYPQMHYNLVRPGIILYGVSPNPEQIKLEEYGLKPAMKFEAQLINVKKVGAGSGVSYGHEYTTTQDTNLGIVPLGYADGILRSCGGTDTRLGAPVLVGEKRANISGRVCMDQFMIDLGEQTDAKAGDWVTLFGTDDGDPKVDEWAKAGETIGYEILTKVTPNAQINYIGEVECSTELGGK